MKTELEKLGYEVRHSETLGYTEWNNYKEGVRMSYDSTNQTFYIRAIAKRIPLAVTAKELMALLIDTGYAGVVK